jgi:hypothetical protein
MVFPSKFEWKLHLIILFIHISHKFIRSTFGSKSTTATELRDWAWAYPTYEFTISKAKPFIKSITIDPKEFMADVNKENNKM